MGQTKTILGFIAGASIGAIAAILLAPDSGKNTRNKIIDKSGDIKDGLKEAVIGFIDKLQRETDEEIAQSDVNTIPKTNSDIL